MASYTTEELHRLVIKHLTNDYHADELYSKFQYLVGKPFNGTPLTNGALYQACHDTVQLAQILYELDKLGYMHIVKQCTPKTYDSNDNDLYSIID